MKDYKEFLRYVVPSMLAFALSGVYAVADGFFVGNALGDGALAAVNIAYPVTALLQACGTGIGMGGAVRYATADAAGDQSRKRRFFGAAILLLAGTGMLLTGLFLVLAPTVLRLFGASGSILDLAREYLLFISFGAVFQLLGTGLVPFIRNMGGSITAMAAMIAGFVTNILLDYLLVWRFPFGMAGAAAATAVGQAVTVLVCLLFFAVKKERPSFRFEHRFAGVAKSIVAVGLSPFGLAFSPNLTLILVNKSAALYGGAAAVTCYAPVSYLCAVVLLLLQGVSDGSQPLLSRCYGKGDPDRAGRFRNLAFLFACLTALLCMGVLFAGRGRAAALFGASAGITANVAAILPVFISGYLFIAVSRVTTSWFYTTEKNLFAYLVIYGEIAALFVLLLILPRHAGILGTWAAVPLSWFFAMVFGLFFLFREKRPKLS